jgi:hypothetical protein
MITYRYAIRDGKTIKTVYDANGIVSRVEEDLPDGKVLYQHYKVSNDRPYHNKTTPNDIRCSLLCEWLQFDDLVKVLDDEDGIPVFNYTHKGENKGVVVPHGIFINENQVVLLDPSLTPIPDRDGDFKSFTMPFNPLPKGYAGVLKYDVRYSLTDNLIEFRRNPLTSEMILPVFPTKLDNDYDIISVEKEKRFNRVVGEILQELLYQK